MQLRHGLAWWALPFLLGCRSVETAPTESLPVERIQVNGVELACVEEGKGDTVVFVHGAEGDWRTCEGVRPWISAKYLVRNSCAGRMAGLVALKYPELLRSVMLGTLSLVAAGSAQGRPATDAIRHGMVKAGAAAKAGFANSRCTSQVE